MDDFRRVRHFRTTGTSISRLFWMPLRRTLLWTNSKRCGRPSRRARPVKTESPSTYVIRSKTLDADLCIFYNLFLLQSTMPTILTKGVTSLIRKENQPTSPAEFRPITVLSTILWLSHKILASRLDKIPNNNAQKGFRSMDGICENIILSKLLIKRAQKESIPLCICLLDIKKAFNSISHESLQRAIERKGVPQQIRKYIAQLCR